MEVLGRRRPGGPLPVTSMQMLESWARLQDGRRGGWVRRRARPHRGDRREGSDMAAWLGF